MTGIWNDRLEAAESDDWRRRLVARILRVVMGALFLVAMHWFSMYVRWMVLRMGERRVTRMMHEGVPDDGRVSLAFVTLCDLVYWSIMGMSVYMVMRYVGFEASGLLAMLGAAGFAVGLALQGTLSDFASGILLSLYQWYAKGDLIEVHGQLAFVRSFNLMYTTLEDATTKVVVHMPNRKLQEAVVINHTRNPVRATVVWVRIGNMNTMRVADILSLLSASATQIPGVLSDPAPTASVKGMESGGTLLRVVAWTDAENYLPVSGALHTHLRQVLDHHGVALADVRFPPASPAST